MSEADRFAGTAVGFMQERRAAREGNRSPAEKTGPLTMTNSINTKICFQQEEKAKADARRQARISIMRKNKETLQSKASEAMVNFDNREQQALINRAARLDRANV